MKKLTFRELLHTARLCLSRGYTIRDTMIFLYGLDHALEHYYKE